MSVDIHALSGAYAVDAVDDLERARFERHLAECETCRAEVASLREAGALVSATSYAMPRPGLRAEILDSVATVRPLPPIVVAAGQRGRAARRRLPALVAAAVALIAVGAVGATVWTDSTGGSQGTYQAAVSDTDAVLRATDAQRISSPLPRGGSITVVHSPSLNKAVVVAEGVANPPAGKNYELWLKQGDDMVPAGAIAGGDTTKLLEGDPATASDLGITIERAGVEPAEPTTPPYAFIPLQA